MDVLLSFVQRQLEMSGLPWLDHAWFKTWPLYILNPAVAIKFYGLLIIILCKLFYMRQLAKVVGWQVHKTGSGQIVSVILKFTKLASR